MHNCRSIQSSPRPPSSLECIAEQDCTSLETLSNQVIAERTSGNVIRLILPAESILGKTDLEYLLQFFFKGFIADDT